MTSRENCPQGGSGTKTTARIAELHLVLDQEKISGLKGVALKDQLKLFKSKGAPNLQQGPLPTKVGDICKAVRATCKLRGDGTLKRVNSLLRLIKAVKLANSRGVPVIMR